MSRALKSTNYKYSELIVLSKIIAGPSAELFLFDPFNKVKLDFTNTHFKTCNGKKILFNFGTKLIRYKQYELIDFDYIVDFSNEIIEPFFKEENLNLIMDSQSHIRWIFNTKEKQMKFLDFYSKTNYKSKSKYWLIKGIIKLGLTSTISKKIKLLSNSKPYFESFLDENSYEYYSIFTGTPGFWRKPVIQIIKNGEVSNYMKLAISTQTSNLITSEIRNITRVKNKNFETIKIPLIGEKSNKHLIITENLGNSKTRHLKQQHIKFCKEMLDSTNAHLKLSETIFFQQIKNGLLYLQSSAHHTHQKQIATLKLMTNSIDSNTYIHTALAHGDFTPWNTILEDGKLSILDWEMADFNAPSFYDIFHFIHQSEGLVNRKNAFEIKRSIYKTFSNVKLNYLVKKYKLDVNFYHKLYLLHIITKNLFICSFQKTITKDQNLQLKNWYSSLKLHTFKNKKFELRQLFLNEFQSFMTNKRYALLKSTITEFKNLPKSSDLDLAIDISEFSKISVFINDCNSIKKVKIISKSFMKIIKIHFFDDSYLCIDLIHNFFRKSQEFLDIDKLLDYTKLKNGVKFPFLFHDIEYAQLFYTLNKSNLPLKYVNKFNSVLSKSDLNQEYCVYMKKIYDINFTTPLESFEYSKLKHLKFRRKLNARFKRNRFINLRNRINYISDTWKDIINNRGFMISFSGVDGSGKSTMIEEIKSILQSTYRKEVVVLRHRPGILPIISSIKHGSSEKAEHFSSISLPRQGNNQSKVTSLFRFLYYYTDYLFGQFYVLFKYILKGKIVIYDRYYFDFINDSRRSNIVLNRNFIKSLYRFVYKPKYNFYLYNDYATILSRKQELEKEDIIELNENYQNLFREYSRKNTKGNYIKIKNDRIDNTVSLIMNQIRESA